ncbi:hypothetical protein OG588_27175 [Streptomyces prunicolor]|uniref:hypothetical protein n=1 Tax=Streptomyces prunicolor TaxID=67348 RepID=UPI003869E23C|nr:hypothetical protein OG588_27175 [Streptomyces prunicolor]
MGQRAQAAGGCLTAVLGAGVGLAVWSYDVRARFQRFEASPDWSVLYAELPLAVLGGVLVSLGIWVVVQRAR